jgi:hypothetical protein
MSLVLTPVRWGEYWRVKLAWPDAGPRYFGKFQSKEEAEKWIAAHHWLTTRPQLEPGAEYLEADDDRC